MKVAVVPLRVTTPDTAPVPPLTKNVAPLIVVESMAVLKVAEIAASTAISLEVSAGTVDVTVGGEVPPVVPVVVKVHVKSLASGVPVASFAPLVMVAV